MYKRTLVNILASKVDAYHHCIETNNDWSDNHQEMITKLVANYMPHGSGFDNGTVLDIGGSTGEKLVFHTSYHHMNEDGYYDGWTEHTVTVKPSLVFGFVLAISGPNRNDIKELIGQDFEYQLSRYFVANHDTGTYVPEPEETATA